MAHAEKRLKWERMGLCTNCGGLKLEPKFNTCAKCREKSREKMRRLYAKDNVPEPVKLKIAPEIRKDHKCWYCEWKKFEGDRFFCPFAEGTCVKDGTVRIGLEEEKHNED